MTELVFPINQSITCLRDKLNFSLTRRYGHICFNDLQRIDQSIYPIEEQATHTSIYFSGPDLVTAKSILYQKVIFHLLVHCDTKHFINAFLDDVDGLVYEYTGRRKDDWGSQRHFQDGIPSVTTRTITSWQRGIWKWVHQAKRIDSIGLVRRKQRR